MLGWIYEKDYFLDWQAAKNCFVFSCLEDALQTKILFFIFMKAEIKWPYFETTNFYLSGNFLKGGIIFMLDKF